MFIETTGDLFASHWQFDAIVNPVNCVGVMGAGLALAFKQRYPDNFKHYTLACQNHQLTPGAILLYRSSQSPCIMNLATKQHWKNPSELAWINKGLTLIKQVNTKYPHILNIGMPAIGCGKGQLPYIVVRDLIEKTFHTSEINVRLFKPY